MVFSRTFRHLSDLSADQIKQKLVGKHVKIHNLDFEVYEKEDHVKVIPHAEQIEAIKTLPIAHVDFVGKGGQTQVVISTKMRRIDQGGPTLIVVFCAFLLAGGIVPLFAGSPDLFIYSYVLLGSSLLIFSIFWTRMQYGYFDYVRKIRDYVRNQSN